jgi:hypothetical protein
MVTPAAKREAVAHLQSELEAANGGRAQSWKWIGPRCVIAAREQTTTRSAFACAP